jgi:hypothetical protein
MGELVREDEDQRYDEEPAGHAGAGRWSGRCRCHWADFIAETRFD